MENIVLIIPTIEYSADIMAFRAELLGANDDDSFAGCGGLRNCETAEDWLNLLARQGDEHTCADGYVPSTTYIAVRVSDNKIVGMIDLRHRIDTPILSTWGGHMGYSVRPSERGRGYATEMLRLNLQNCRIRGLDKVLLTCNSKNHASEKTIISNGGIFANEICVDDSIIKRFWITL